MMATLFMFSMLAVILASSPFSLGALLIILTLLASVFISSTFSAWTALMTLIIIGGGVLVLFSYFISVSSNTKPEMKPLSLFAIFSASLTYWIFCKTPLLIFSSYEFLALTWNSLLISPTQIMLFTVLLLVMLLVIKLVKLEGGPLRGLK